MAQHLCIVAHDSPLLLGYLNIVLQHLTAGGNELQIIIDRRPDLPLRKEPVPPPPALVSDQRRVRGVDELLRTQGYAIVSRRDGMSWQLSDGGQLPAEELDAADELEEEDATRTPGRRRTLVSALVFAAAVVSVAMVLGCPRQSLIAYSSPAEMRRACEGIHGSEPCHGRWRHSRPGLRGYSCAQSVPLA